MPDLARATRGVLLVAGAAAAFQWWVAGLGKAVETLVDLVALTLAAVVVTSTTPVNGMLDALVRWIGPLRRVGVDPQRVAMTFALAIQGFPATVALALETRDAAQARGLGRHPRAYLGAVRRARDRPGARDRGRAARARHRRRLGRRRRLLVQEPAMPERVAEHHETADARVVLGTAVQDDPRLLSPPPRGRPRRPPSGAATPCCRRPAWARRCARPRTRPRSSTSRRPGSARRGRPGRRASRWDRPTPRRRARRRTTPGRPVRPRRRGTGSAHSSLQHAPPRPGVSGGGGRAGRARPARSGRRPTGRRPRGRRGCRRPARTRRRPRAPARPRRRSGRSGARRRGTTCRRTASGSPRPRRTACR